MALVSVVVPVYNEAANIAACLDGLAAALGDVPHELLVCYDFPGDTTLPAIAAMPVQPPGLRLIHNTLGRGAAFAIRAGLAAAAGDVVVVTMADLSDDPRVIPAMAAKVRAGAAVVAGSRYCPGGSQEGGPLLKRTLSRLAGISLRAFTGVGTHDCTNTFRAFAKSYLERVQIESTKGFDISLELTAKAHLMNLRVDEVPSSWRDRTAGESRFQLFRWLPLYLKWYLLALFTDHLPDRARARSPWLFLAAFVVVFLGIVQLPSAVAGDGLDAGWPVALADGFLRRWPGSGVDIAFTYGPFGWVYGAAYLPGLFWQSLMTEVVVKAALALWIARAAFALPGASAVTAVALTAWIGREDALLWLGFLLAWRRFRARPERPRWRQSLACVWLAYVGLTKSTLLVVGAGAVCLYAALWARTAGDAVWVAVAWSSSVAALWALVGGRLGELPAWLAQILEIVRGYPESMGTWDRPAWEVGAGVAALGAVAVGARRGLTPLDLLVGFAVFKQAFVRHDAYHVGSFWAWLALWPLITPAVSRRFAAACALAGLALLAPLRDLPHMARTPLDNARALAAPRAVRAGLDAQWDVYRRAHALPALAQVIGHDSVDVMPGSQIGVLLLNGFDYRPRPLFGYKTLTPALAEANAAFLRSTRAPDFVLEAPLDVDGRYAPGNDALARLELERRYDRIATERGYALHARRKQPRPPLVHREIARRKLAFGETLDLPSGRPWVRATFTPTVVGRLAGLCYKNPAITIDTGAGAPARVVLGAAAAGCEVRAKQLAYRVAPGDAWFYDPAIDVVVESLEEPQ